MWLGYLAAVIVAGLVLWGVLRLIAATPVLLQDVDACRGNWAEARVRDCGHREKKDLPVEPFNSFSSLAYVVAGWTVYHEFHTMPAAVLGAALTLNGVGSALYHGTKAMWAVRLDNAGMYAVFGSLAIYSVEPPHEAGPYVMLAGAAVYAIGFTLVMPGDINARMGLLLSLLSVRGFLLGHTFFSALSLGIFAVAFTAWLLDKNTLVLARFGHTIWHLGTAAAIGLMFKALLT